MGSTLKNVPQPDAPRWLTVEQAATHAQVSAKSIYRACQSKKLRHARLSGRRSVRLLAAWVNEWLIASAAPVEVSQ